MVSTLVVDSGRDAKALAKEVEAVITKQPVVLASERRPARPGRSDVEGAIGEIFFACVEKSIPLVLLLWGAISPIDANAGCQ